MSSNIPCALGFIGAGNMAEAILRGIIDRKLIRPEAVMVSDPDGNRLAFCKKSFGVHITGDNAAVVNASATVLLAVKPQVAAAVLAPLRDLFRRDQVVMSIAAGIRTETLDRDCGGAPAIIRVMPNTPALIGQGITAICPGPRAGEAALQAADRLFQAVGPTLRVDESAMDAVTAISGSGPAYVFYWLEAMLKAAGELGFDPATARQLVYQTLSGAAALAASSADPPEVLRAKVTSKGGTTEAAIRTLDEHQAGAALIAAVKAAAARSRALSAV